MDEHLERGVRADAVLDFQRAEIRQTHLSPVRGCPHPRPRARSGEGRRAGLAARGRASEREEKRGCAENAAKATRQLLHLLFFVHLSSLRNCLTVWRETE